jgi:hypothetical protein
MRSLPVHCELPEIHARRDRGDILPLPMDEKGKRRIGRDFYIRAPKKSGDECRLEIIRQLQHQLTADPVCQTGKRASNQ